MFYARSRAVLADRKDAASGKGRIRAAALFADFMITVWPGRVLARFHIFFAVYHLLKIRDKTPFAGDFFKVCAAWPHLKGCKE